MLNSLDMISGIQFQLKSKYAMLLLKYEPFVCTRLYYYTVCSLRPEKYESLGRDIIV